MDPAHGKAISHPFALRHGNLLSSVWAIALFALVIFGGSLAWSTFDEYEATLAQEYRFLESHARFGEAEVAGALRGIDLLLQSVIDDQLSPSPLSSEAVQRRELTLLKQFPEIHFLITTDARGKVVTAESLDDPASVASVRTFDASQREYFTAHRDAKATDFDRYLLSRPFKTITNLNTITLSRAIRDKQGQFKGVALVSMSPEFFKTVLLQVLPEDASATATLFNRLGDVIYRLPDPEANVGRNIGGAAGLKGFLGFSERMTHYVGISDLDGAKRVFVFSKIGDTELGLAVTSQLDVVMAGWRHNLWLRLLSFVLTAGVTLALVWDIRRRVLEGKRVEADLRIAAVAFDSQEGILVTDADTVILRVNRAFSELTGYTPEEIVGQTPRLLQSGRHDAAFFQSMWDGIHRSGGWQGEIWDRHKNGKVFPKWLTISAVRGADGAVTHYVGTQYDITERKRAQEQINELAFFDQLTHLPNRILLMDRLQQNLAVSSRSKAFGALLFIDLDNFKTLNDTQGHEMGDLLLTQVADRLRLCVRLEDTASRVGGDEFVVILSGLSTDEKEAANATETAAEKILLALSQPYSIGNLTHRSTASIGATLFNGQSVAVDDLMKQADLAMYRSKASGRNAVRFFDPAMEAAVRVRAETEDDLRLAIDAKQFVLRYQAQVVDDGRVTGAEVLVRWQHPQRGIVPPAEFIPLAEETGLILPLGQWVLETACAQLAAWGERPDMMHLSLAVNVSAHQFRQRDFVQQVLAAVTNAGANPHRLKLELTESLLVHDVEEIIEKMYVLKSKGIGFSLDDFGTGYSSLTYLKRLPLDQLKIDSSFVRDVLSDPNDAAIARTVVALAQSLGLSVIAEGVETKGQRDFLANSGCHAYQGYFFSKPVPVEDFEQLVQPG
jgi:diguanylate cyclase (GGDEF)-like protein/PAS domain S-box-containing protein